MRVISGPRQGPAVYAGAQSVEDIRLGAQLEWTVLVVAMLASGAMILSFDALWAGVVSMALVTVVAVLVVRAEILHPYTWFLPSFFLYSCSLPILVLLETRPDQGGLQDMALLEWIAMCAFTVVVGPARPRIRLNPAGVLNLGLPSWWLFVTSWALTAMYVAGIWLAGYTGKYQIALSTAWFVRLDPAFSVLALVFAVLLANALMRGRRPWILVLFTIAWNTAVFTVNGERDYVFRILWITIFMVHVLYRRLGWRTLALIAAGLLLLIPPLEDLKNVAVTERPIEVTLENLLVRFLSDEFLTASENLRLLVQDNPWPDLLWGRTLWWDLKQVAYSGSLFPTAPRVAPVGLFNEMFFPSVVAAGGGRGFSLVGEGYMNFGVAGAAIWYAGLGLFVRYLYRKGAGDVLWLIAYVVTMPLVVYVTRADLANLISQFGKHILLPLGVIYLCKHTPLAGLRRKQRPRWRVEPDRAAPAR